jgi:lipoprotein NlpD
LRRSGWFCALGVFCLLLGGCADRVGGESGVYVVRPNDTLYSIAWRYGLDFHDLARWNDIGPDFRIAVGQALTLSPRGGPREDTHARRPAPAPPGAPVQAAPASSKLQWAWPTDPAGAPLPVSGGGVLITGRVGQEVRAACNGRVVYAGTGIRGYGNLIIVKHGENLLSAYAHNRDSLVREGQELTLGQVIAHMGEGAPNRPALYFEIRRNGKPVDPLRFLPVGK